MHELGLCDALLRMVDGIVAEEKLTAVHKITLEIGELSGVVPRFMTDCWTAVADGTCYAQTALVIETVPGAARCEDCGVEFRVNPDDLRCPVCHGSRLTPISGKDMTLKEIEAD